MVLLRNRAENIRIVETIDTLECSIILVVAVVRHTVFLLRVILNYQTVLVKLTKERE